MNRFPIRKFLVCLLAALLFSTSLAFPQQRSARSIFEEKPVMENVFYNVVWGSLLGIVLGAASAVIEAEEKTSPEGLRDKIFGGATAGGMIGLGVGLWLFSTGITFDDEGTLLFTGRDPDEATPAVAANALPFVLETSSRGAPRITGFRVTVLDFRF